MMQIGDSIFKRKCCDRISEGRPKRTRKTTKGDGWRNGTGDSQRRIRGADTDPLIEDDGGSDRYESDSDSDTEDNDDIDGHRGQMFTRAHLRRQYDQALVNGPALQQHYLIMAGCRRRNGAGRASRRETAQAFTQRAAASGPPAALFKKKTALSLPFLSDLVRLGDDADRRQYF
jgi:hypothetical protein